MCDNIQTHRALWGTPFPVGGEWDAGYISIRRPGNLVIPASLVFVRRTETAFEVVRREYRTDGVGVNRVLKVFPVVGLADDEVDAVEVEAKCFALAYRDRGG